MNREYQLYTVTNTLTKYVYVAHTYTKVNFKTKYFSTNKSLYEDLHKYDFAVFKRTVIATANTQNDIKNLYRKYLVALSKTNTKLYNDVCSYGYIYLTTNTINGMKYIGQHRISGNPKLDDNYFGSGARIVPLINDIGIDKFKKEILEECNSEDELNEREKYWIRFYNAVKDPMFYNIAEGGEFGDVWSGKSEEEKNAFRQIIALSNKRRKRDISKISGNKNPAFGRHWYKDIINKVQYYLYPDDELIIKLNLERGMFRSKEHN